MSTLNGDKAVTLTRREANLQVHESMKPLHFKPMCLAIDCAKSGIVVKKQGRQCGIWNGKKTANTTKNVKAFGQSLESLIITIVVGGTNISDQMWSCRCASDEAVVATIDIWYMGKSCGSSATK
nr:hypothetical protein [Tanacetum cinerariifolium]